MISRISRHLWPVLGEPIPVRPSIDDEPIAETIAPEVPPAELNGRDYAIFLLRLAAEIEHGLMVQYLFAAYSLGGPDVPPAEQARVRAWQDVILGVAKEEMAHLVTVQNLLTALGGPLQFNREDYPNDNVLFESGFRLHPFSQGTLATYIVAESPGDWESRDPDQAREIRRQAFEETGGVVNRVGRLYQELIDVIGNATLVPDSAFDAGSGVFQASWDAWGRGFRRGQRDVPGAGRPDDPDPRDEHELVIATVTSRATALEALRLIADQGEGFGSPEDDESHFDRFIEIHQQLSALGEAERRALVRLLAPNPTTHLDGRDVKPKERRTPTSTSAISNPEARLWAHLFNVRYRKLLVSLSHAFELAADRADSGAPGPRGTLINRSFAEMYNLRSIAGVLVGLALDHADPDGERAGPPFQMPHTLMLPHDEPDRWRLHRDMLDASATLLERITTGGGAVAGRAYADALIQADRIERDQVELLIGAPQP